MSDAVLLVDSRGLIAFANEQAQSLFRAGASTLEGQPVESLVPRNARAVHQEHRLRYASAPERRRMGAVSQLHALRMDGTELPVDISLSTITMGPNTYVLASIRDVTWREQLLGELRDSERRYRVVVEGAAEVFYQIAINGDPHRGKIQFVSPQCERLTGYAPDAFVSDPNLWAELVHADDQAALSKATASIVKDRRGETRYYRLRHRSGEYRHIADRVQPVVDAAGVVVGLQGVARDITDRVLAEQERQELAERLRQAERMEALGRLAGGVAHDFNNLLTAILGFSEAALGELEPGSPAYRDVQEVTKAGKRAANVARQLLGFSRKQVIAPRVVDMNAHLVSLNGMLRRTAGEQIELKLALAPHLWPVFLDPSQVDQVIINLVANARDATTGAGPVTIATENVTLDEPFCCANPGCAPGDHVLIQVRDSGSGMDDITLKNAFVPFFTTKIEGVGTGIGLASVYGIVKQNMGFIKVETAVSRGTTMSVYFPRHLMAAGDASAAPLTAGEPEQGREVVLLVEDNDQVRGVTKRILTQLGYTVLEAARPTDAMAISDSFGGVIHLLLTDVVMPGMSGDRLATKIRESRPAIATLFISGYAPQFATGAERTGAAINYLAKPFDQASLAAAIRDALKPGRA